MKQKQKKKIMKKGQRKWDMQWGDFVLYCRNEKYHEKKEDGRKQRKGE
jgi:hypothetical protein